MLLKQVWDHALVRRIPIMYRRTFDTGTMTGTFERKGLARITVSDWPEPPMYEVVGLQVGVETMLTRTGRANASARVTHGGWGRLSGALGRRLSVESGIDR